MSAPRKALPHNYGSEHVHLAQMFGPDEHKRFKCFRCKRDMPMDSFEPLFRVTDKIRGGGRRSLAWVQALHPNCWTCRKQQSGQWSKHPLYLPDIDRYFTNALSGIRASASSRGIVFAISKDDILGRYLEQGGLCNLTGMQMDFNEAGTIGRGKRAKMTPSVDRIDSHGNYTVDNIQIVCAVINLMKNDLATDQFIALCERVAGHQMDKLFK
jgi:hypothetical protein